jgi:amidase
MVDGEPILKSPLLSLQGGNVPASDLCFEKAAKLADLIRRKEISAREVMEAHLSQIGRINPSINAIITLLPEEALKLASEADQSMAKGAACGPLHGLPVAHKDLVHTKGIRTTYGSPIFKDFFPKEDALIVERLKKAGAVTIGKTNTPEFGAGGQTYNEVFGETLNPYDLTKTCGGSSGGAAAALACGMIPIADGSDFGGSLRIPANFCNVVGFRPSPGRVPTWPSPMAWFPMAVEGPMARTVGDIALLLSALAGPDARAPISICELGSVFGKPLERDFKGVRIAWSRDLGSFPVDPAVIETIEKQLGVFESFGCSVENDHPDFTDAHEIFRTLRAWRFEVNLGHLLEHHREELKKEVIFDIEAGISLKGPQIGKAELKRTELYHRVRQFFENYEFLVLPVNQVPPFDIHQRFVTEIDGIKMQTYFDWMKSCYFISVVGLPAISVPCGFTSGGLPIGIQIVGRHHDDFGVLQIAHAFEQATEFWKKRPPIIFGSNGS